MYISNNIKPSKLLFVFLLFLSFYGFSENEFQGIKTVVIDAGHGGKDPGCKGIHTREKDVTLAISLKLGYFIEKSFPNIKVVYTRKTDVFVELDERAQIANRNNADLFICIHANAGSATAYGVETYVLGLHKTDAQRQIADRENASILFEDDGGDKYKDVDLSVDAIIARQLQLSVYLDHSIMFASKIQEQIKKIGRHDRGVKQAGFLVLYKTTMPSVLIETGFLSNAQEEAFLKDTANQTKMANSFFQAFIEYKKYYEVGMDPISQNSSDNSIYGLKEKDISPDKVVFRVQIETNAKKIPLNNARFQGMPVWMYQSDDLFKYTVGAFNDFESANNLKKKMREKGFEHAFVVAFYQNERINLEKAIKLAEN